MIAVRGYAGKRVAVFGLGRSGLATARALKAGGAEPILWDDKPENLKPALKEGLTVENLTFSEWEGVDALVIAPGVPLTHPQPHWTVLRAKELGIPILGDIELFAETVAQLPVHKRPKVVAITGTNGKSTTTALIGHILHTAGKRVHIGGNIGIGLLSLPEIRADAIYVIETSSYQLDLTHSFKPNVAVLMNFSPDHLDRHGDMDGYIAAKRRIFANLGPDETAVIGVDDPHSQKLCTELVARGGPNVRPISARRAIGGGVYALGGLLYDSANEGTQAVTDLNTARSLTGRHNWQNAAAAYAAVRALGLTLDQAAAGLQSFPGLAHRMQEVGRIGKVRFVNDSKATNADAARQAMSSYPNFYWIAGGKAKAGGIEDLADLFPRIIKAFLIGEAAELFAKTLGQRAPHMVAGQLDVAVAQAFGEADATGEDAVVLLSPACASFDQFPDFEKRGEAFEAAVNAIAKMQAQMTVKREAVT